MKLAVVFLLFPPMFLLLNSFMSLLTKDWLEALISLLLFYINVLVYRRGWRSGK